MMNKIWTTARGCALSLLALLWLAGALSAQDLPEQPMPRRLVNDLAHLFSVQEQAVLEQKLLAYNDSSSTQIAVVTVASLNGMDKANFAVDLAHKWGVGQKGKDNGVLILIKPKTPDSKGQTYIAVGYGIEHLVTDAVARRIVEQEMIPYFKQGLMFAGVNAAVDTLFQLLSGQFTADEYNGRGNGTTGVIIFVIMIVLIVFIVFGNGNNGGSRHISSGSFPWWLLLSGGSGGRSGFGSSGGFSGGGFGGFGGGGFGGGGAGGSW